MEGSDQWIQAERILIQGFLAVLALTHKDSPADFLLKRVPLYFT